MPSFHSNLPTNNRIRINQASPAHQFRNRLLQRTFSSLDLNSPDIQRNRYTYREVVDESILSDSSDEEEQTDRFFHSPIDLYRLAVRTNSEILEDLTAIIRILRQMNAIHRIFNHNSTTRDDIENEEETNKLLETGLTELQHVLSAEHKRQSTLALLSLLTCQQSQYGCSEQYLRQYLDPNGEYNPHLAMFAAAICDDDDEYWLQPRSCQDIMTIAEEILGPSWLDDFHKGKECVLRKMLEKLAFVAKIRIRVRDQSSYGVSR